MLWARLAVSWYFLAAFAAPAEHCAQDSGCISQPLVDSHLSRAIVEHKSLQASYLGVFI